MRPTIAARLYLLVGIATLALLLVVAAAAIGAGRMAAAGERLHQRGVEGVQQASRLALLFERQRGLVSRAPAETDLQLQRAYRAEFDLLNTEIDESRRQVQNLVPIGVRPRADALATLFSDLRGHAAKVFDLAANFVQDQATDALNGPFAETAKRIDAELQTILKSMRVNAQAEADELVDARVSLLQEIAAVSSMALAALLGSASCSLAAFPDGCAGSPLR
jgi:hypothetical protein